MTCDHKEAVRVDNEVTHDHLLWCPRCGSLYRAMWLSWIHPRRTAKYNITLASITRRVGASKMRALHGHNAIDLRVRR